MINTLLLESTLDHIKSYPELHHQWGYFEVNEFGLAACFAARSLLISGYEAMIGQKVGSKSCLAQHPRTGETVGVWPEAQKRLRLNNETAKRLFTATNTRESIEQTIKDLLNTAPQRF